MKTADLFQETYTALSANKARSGLTILGIVIGIASVIALISIGQGTQGTIQSSIQGLGSNLLAITPGAAQQGRGFVSSGRGAAESLTLSDAQALAGVSGVAAVSPEIQSRFQVVSQIGNNTNTTVIGVAPAYISVHNITMAEGSFLSQENLDGLSRVVVVGPTAAQDLFGDADPLGQTLRINKGSFKVIGVTQAKGGSGFFNQDDTLFVPLTTMQKILVGHDWLSTVGLSVADKNQMTDVQQAATSLLADRHHVDPATPDFSILSQADILGALTSVTQTFTIFLASIAGISLLVGGIGIMNMMLTTVTERTREIGLRKAIGAKRFDISLQFLAESVLLTFIGGAVGITLGWLISLAVSKFASIATTVSFSSVALAVGVSMLIGVVFGYYPARRAARLHPIEALRYE